MLALMLMLVGFAAPAQATDPDPIGAVETVVAPDPESTTEPSESVVAGPMEESKVEATTTKKTDPLVERGNEVLSGGYICHINGDGTYTKVGVKTLNDLVEHRGHVGDMSRDYVVVKAPVSKLEDTAPNTAGTAQWSNGCARELTVIYPPTPTVTNPRCEDGVLIPATIDLQTTVAGYRPVAERTDAGFKVTFAAANGYVFENGLDLLVVNIPVANIECTTPTDPNPGAEVTPAPVLPVSPVPGGTVPVSPVPAPVVAPEVAPEPAATTTPSAAPVAVASPVAAQGELAYTGAKTGLVWLAVGLLLVGLAAVVVPRVLRK